MAEPSIKLSLTPRRSRGKMIIRCAWCDAEGKDGYLGSTPTGNGVTHGICDRHLRQLKEEAAKTPWRKKENEK